MIDERDLVDEASRGSPTAVTTLLERHLDGLRRFVRHQVDAAVASKESSDDLVQSVCREVLERLGREEFEYRGEAAFRSWLYQAAVLKLRNRTRFYRAPRRDVAREGGAVEEVRAVRVATPSAHAAVREEMERLSGAIGQLPPRYRTVVELAQLDGLSHVAIARRLGVTESHSRVLLSRALARLGTLMAAEPHDDPSRTSNEDEPPCVDT